MGNPFGFLLNTVVAKKNFLTSSSNDIHLKSAYSNLFTYIFNPLFIKDRKDVMWKKISIGSMFEYQLLCNIR